MTHIQKLLLFLSVCAAQYCKAQTDTVNQPHISQKFVTAVSGKLTAIDKKISKQTVKALKKFERQENKIKRRLYNKDSVAAKEIFANSIEKLNQLQSEFESMPDKVITKLKGEYNAYIDTLQTTFKLLQDRAQTLKDKSQAVQDKLTNATSKLNIMQGKLQKTEEIKKYLKERRQYLKQQLEKFGMVKQLKKLEKTSFYYTEYIKEYKALLKDRKKAEQKAMALLYSTPFFKKFVKKNSLLASLFSLPNNGVATATAAIPAIAGLQTRQSVQQLIQTNITAGGPNAAAQVRQQIQAGQAELSKLREKIAQLGSADAEIPSFKPNTQKTKSFLKRLEYGADLQFGKANNFLPNNSNIAVSLGYKLHTNGSFGIAAAYKLGLGKGWNNIKFTHEGLGVRSYIDWKLKGRFYVSGGYEQNYNSSFKTIEQLKNYTAWQSSGLIGVSKKIQAKANKGAKLQLLFDFLYNQHKPVTQPFIFRTGITLK